VAVQWGQASSAVNPADLKWASLLKASRSRSSFMTVKLKQSVKDHLFAMFLINELFVFSNRSVSIHMTRHALDADTVWNKAGTTAEQPRAINKVAVSSRT